MPGTECVFPGCEKEEAAAFGYVWFNKKTKHNKNPKKPKNRKTKPRQCLT